MDSKLVHHWKRAAEDLRIDVLAPFDVSLPSGRSIRAAVLLPQFGAVRGMVIVDDYSIIEPYLPELLEAGFGFSVMHGPRDGDPYVREEVVEVLSDWGWAGPEEDRPLWLRAPSEPDEGVEE